MNDVKRKELKALAFIVIILFPVLSIIFVGGYGLVVWIYFALGGVVSH